MATDNRNVTQKDVAKLAGVSSAVVSYVINNGPRQVSEETRNRVLTAIDSLGYRPNKFAQALGKNQTDSSENQVGIVIGGSSAVLQRPFYGGLLAGLFDYIHELGHQFRFLHFWDELQDPVLFNTQLHKEQISGLVLIAADLMRIDPNYQALMTTIKRRITRIVCLDTVVDDLPTVTFDRAAAARLVVNHLLELGHERIAFVGNTGRRVSSYKHTLLERGIAVAPELIVHPGINNSPEEGFEGTCRLLALEQLPTAIFAASDDVAIGVLNALHSAGKRVPDDIAVVAIDNSPVAPYLWPPLTTVHVPTLDLGRHALDILTKMPEKPISARMTVMLDVELIVRTSCGAKR
jgi:LacI family transcriptional regulator